MKTNCQIAVVLVGVLVFPVCWTYAGRKIYHTGILVSVEQPTTPLPLPSGQTVGIPVDVLHQFVIEESDVLYIGSCLEKDYPKPKWQTGETVQFRREKDKMYLKKPRRGELELHFLLSMRLGPNGKPIAVLDSLEVR